MPKWKYAERPGLAGEQKEQKIEAYNEKYGEGNWRIMWKVDTRTINLDKALELYETSYLLHFYSNRVIWGDLTKNASEVWVEEEIDVESGIDYSIQRSKANHYEDIAIRRILNNQNIKFRGSELLQIRGDSDYLSGRLLSSMRVPFCLPELIEEPREYGWWKRNSVEDFWQSNKILQVKNKSK